MKPDWILDLTYIERRAKEMGWALSYPNKETIKQEWILGSISSGVVQIAAYYLHGFRLNSIL